MNFSINLKKIRESKGIKREELANELLNLGTIVKHTAIRDWEQGIREPKSYQDLENLTIILNCSYDDLLK